MQYPTKSLTFIFKPILFLVNDTIFLNSNAATTYFIFLLSQNYCTKIKVFVEWMKIA